MKILMKMKMRHSNEALTSRKNIPMKGDNFYLIDKKFTNKIVFVIQDIFWTDLEQNEIRI